MKGIGYREWQPYFAGTQPLELTRQRIISATMNLAKRQRTWFKRNESIQWLSTEEALAQAVAKVTSFLST
jgi:tRNA dimethylallyltransferase